VAKESTFELVVRLPRRVKLPVGRKGEVEVELDKIPEELWPGKAGLLLRGLAKQLQSATAGEAIDRAEATVAAWYEGYPNTRPAGAAKAKADRDAELEKARARRSVQRTTLDAIRAAAAAATGDDSLRGASRREIRRKLGDARFDAVEKMAGALAAGD